MTAKSLVLVQVQELEEPVVAPVVDILLGEGKNVTNAESLDILHVTALNLVDLADTVVVEDTRVEVAMEVGLVKVRLATLVAGMATCPVIAPRDKSATTVGVLSRSLGGCNS